MGPLSCITGARANACVTKATITGMSSGPGTRHAATTRGGKVLRKSAHFDQRWREEIGGTPPSAAELNAMMSECVLLQKYRDVTSKRGRAMKIMALYWHPDRKLVLKVDLKTRKIVTVYTRYTKENAERPIRHDAYTALIGGIP